MKNTAKDTAWTRQHDTHSWLVPFEYKKVDPWELLLELREFIDGLHDYAETWTWNQFGYDNLNMDGFCEHLAAMVGSYRINDARNQKYTNPQYKHEHRFTPALGYEYIDIVAKCANMSIHDLAGQFNATSKLVERYCERQNTTWGDLKAKGRRRLANAIALTLEWTDRLKKEIAVVLGKDPSRVGRWVRQYATVTPGEIPQHKLVYE